MSVQSVSTTSASRAASTTWCHARRGRGRSTSTSSSCRPLPSSSGGQSSNRRRGSVLHRRRHLDRRRSVLTRRARQKEPKPEKTASRQWVRPGAASPNGVGSQVQSSVPPGSSNRPPKTSASPPVPRGLSSRVSSALMEDLYDVMVVGAEAARSTDASSRRRPARGPS